VFAPGGTVHASLSNRFYRRPIAGADVETGYDGLGTAGDGFAEVTRDLNCKETVMKKIQQGFTLIELMIVVAIIGILAAVAIPAYQDYTVRSRVTEGLSLASAGKTGVSEFFASNGTFPADNTEAGLATSTSITGNSVSSVGISNGAITVTFSGAPIAGDTLLLIPTNNNGAVAWKCSPGTINPKYLPSSCRT
jgi:type IV pilus assembly protein PilA